jgi:hypothetical protein
MKQLYTEHDILRFLYDEMDEEEYQSFFEVLCKDPEMWASYESLQETKGLLAEVHLEPSYRTETRILETARQAAEAMRAVPKQKGIKLHQASYWAAFTLVTILTVGYAFHTDWFSAGEMSNPESFTDDHSWIHHRLQRMEDERLLPASLKQNEYQLINYSGQKVFKFTTAQP